MFHHKKRGKSGIYYVYWRENGTQFAKAVSSDLATVKEYELQLANRLQRRRVGLTLNNISFTQLCEEYINEFSRANKRPRSIESDQQALKFFRRDFPQIKQVTQYDENIINAYKAKRRQAGLKDSSINRELNTLTSMLKFAVQKRYLDAERHGTVTRYKVDACARERVLTEEEMKLLIKQTQEPYRTAIYLGYYAGLRRGEAVNLTLDDIDTVKHTLHIRGKKDWQPKTKTSVRDVPLHPFLASQLAKLKGKSKGDYILTFPDGNRLTEGVLTHMCGKIKRRLKIDGFNFHVLRHTFVSRLAGAGGDVYAISRMLGHSNTHITEQVYTHLKDSYYQTNINKLPTV